MVLAILSATDLTRHVRASGEEFGYVYPEKPPEKQMRGPTPILDCLSPANDNFLALPHVMDPLEGVDGLDDMQKSVIRANHETNLTTLQGYHQQVSKAVRAF